MHIWGRVNHVQRLCVGKSWQGYKAPAGMLLRTRKGSWADFAVFGMAGIGYIACVNLPTHDLLVVAPENWDEACFAMSAVRALVASGLGVGVLCHEKQREFWQTLAEIGVLTFPVGIKAKALASLIGGDWAAALVWEPGLAAEALKRAKVPRRLGPDVRELRKCLTHPLVCSGGPLEHRVRFYLSAVEEMGVSTAKPEFFAPCDVGTAVVKGTVLLCPDSDYGPSHEWIPSRWLEVGRFLIENDYRVTVAGLEDGRELGKSLADSLGGGVEFFSAFPLAAALPLLAVHALVVAADGSLPHLAAYLGATCVTLFGPNDPAWKRPLGRQHTFVRRHTECAPCLIARCPLDRRCQEELETDHVIAKIREKVEGFST